MSSSYDSVLIYTSLKCVALAFCTHWQFEKGEDFAAVFHGHTSPPLTPTRSSSAVGSPELAPPKKGGCV